MKPAASSSHASPLRQAGWDAEPVHPSRFGSSPPVQPGKPTWQRLFRLETFLKLVKHQQGFWCKNRLIKDHPGHAVHGNRERAWGSSTHIAPRLSLHGGPGSSCTTTCVCGLSHEPVWEWTLQRNSLAKATRLLLPQIPLHGTVHSINPRSRERCRRGWKPPKPPWPPAPLQRALPLALPHRGASSPPGELSSCPELFLQALRREALGAHPPSLTPQTPL